MKTNEQVNKHFRKAHAFISATNAGLLLIRALSINEISGMHFFFDITMICVDYCSIIFL